MTRAIVANHREVEMRWYRDSETGDLVTGYLLSPAEVASLAEAARTADRPSLREAAETARDALEHIARVARPHPHDGGSTYAYSTGRGHIETWALEGLAALRQALEGEGR